MITKPIANLEFNYRSDLVGSENIENKQNLRAVQVSV